MRKRNISKAFGRSLSQRKEDIILAKSAKVASSSATRSSRVLGLTVKIIKDNNIVEIRPDRSERIVRSINKSSVDISRLKKGLILRKK